MVGHKFRLMRSVSRERWWGAAIGLLVPLGFAGTTAATGTAFKENCANCHARPASLARSVQGTTEQERRKALDRFLSSHYAGDPKLRTEIIDYLIELWEQ